MTNVTLIKRQKKNNTDKVGEKNICNIELRLKLSVRVCVCESVFISISVPKI